MNELTQKYRAKNGKAQFEVFAERDGDMYGMVLNDLTNTWESCKWINGKTRFLSNFYDIEEIPATPEHDLKVDDLVWVRNNYNEHKRIRCFAGWSNDGKILAWHDGETSQSKTSPMQWDDWEKYQPEPVQTSEPATPKWHEHLKTYDEVICYVWNDGDDNKFMIEGIMIYSNNNEYLGNDTWQHAEPIPTQCGKYCTAVKDGKTILLPLE